ncbi:MAG: hypothetical protein IJ660_06755 [Alphaproteobacteria bacterium]|nr:hypothetical protein [Alphaproteobacteria bacterium]
MAKKKYNGHAKTFIFAPESAILRHLWGIHNNVRTAKYIVPGNAYSPANQSTSYLRVRVRSHSDAVVDYAKQYASTLGPIVMYKVGPGAGKKTVATIRVEGEGRFSEIVDTACRVCHEVYEASKSAHEADSAKPVLTLTCRVSDILARDETPWVEIFAVEKHAVPVEVWKEAVKELAEAVGSEAVFYPASIKEFE